MCQLAEGSQINHLSVFEKQRHCPSLVTHVHDVYRRKMHALWIVKNRLIESALTDLISSMTPGTPGEPHSLAFEELDAQQAWTM